MALQMKGVKFTDSQMCVYIMPLNYYDTIPIYFIDALNVTNEL